MFQSIKNLFKKALTSEYEEDIYINILTRTSGRPNGFRKCRESIEEQSYSPIEHIVSYDSDEDLGYLNKKRPTKLIKVRKKKFSSSFAKNGKSEDFKPYNLYCNQLIRQVKTGWILFLDDDDMLLEQDVIEKVVKEIKKAGKKDLLVWQIQYPDGSKIPKNESYHEKKITFMDIDTACFAVHYKLAKSAKWDAWRAADFRYIKKLSEKAQSVIWLQKVFIQKNNFGDQGCRNDISL